MTEISKSNIRLVVLKWTEAYFYDREIHLSLLEIMKIVEHISQYIEKGLDPNVEENLTKIDKWIRTKKKNPSTGSLTLKKE